MPTKYWGLYEEPTTYKQDYIRHNLDPKITSVSNDQVPSENEEKSIPRLETITTNDTFQHLDYSTILPFDALWEPKEAVSINVKATDRRRCLGDEHLENAIKTRPRVYMTPSVSVDDVKNPETRNSIITFTYTTTLNRANREVWEDFRERNVCAVDKASKIEDPPTDRCRDMLPEFQKLGREWDLSQSRSFVETYSLRRAKQSDPDRGNVDTSKEEAEIENLAEKNALNIAYDKFPSLYGGHRTSVALGVPLKKRELAVFHPDVTVSRAIYGRRRRDDSA